MRGVFVAILIGMCACAAATPVICTVDKALDPKDVNSYCSEMYRNGVPMGPGTVCLSRPERLRPTQPAFGDWVVQCNKHLFETMNDKQIQAFVMSKPVPTVIGPDGETYITDHHHFSLSLIQATLGSQVSDPVTARVVYNCVQNNWSNMTSDAFWAQMIATNNTYLRDERGNAITLEQLPHSLKYMRDDPFRALSEYVRDGHGYIKCGEPHTDKMPQCKGSYPPFFLEFIWANFLREKFQDTDFEASLRPVLTPPLQDYIYLENSQGQMVDLKSLLQPAIQYVQSSAAKDLPGFNLNPEILQPTVLSIDNHGCD